MTCHTRPGGTPYAGGRPFQTPVGIIHSSNITPDEETGIGTWSASDLRRAMHEGVAADGDHLFPAFPYTAYTKVTDADVDAIYAFLRTVKPERYEPRKNGIVFSQRWAMALWNALFFKPGRFKPDPTQSAQWNRGAYLVEGLGHCGACHTPRGSLMAEQLERAYAGGNMQDEVAPGKVRRWSGVNLTSAKSGLASWSVDDLAKYLSTGVSRRAGTFGPMNEVIVNSTMQLTREDARAMAVYLKSLPPHESKRPAVTPGQVERGAAIYAERCEKCHSESGRGGLFTGPPLAGSAVVQADDPASLINIILYGPQQSEEVSYGQWETMQSYFDVLSDDEATAVANYVRGSWGNRAPAVTAGQVAEQR